MGETEYANRLFLVALLLLVQSAYVAAKAATIDPLARCSKKLIVTTKGPSQKSDQKSGFGFSVQGGSTIFRKVILPTQRIHNSAQ